MTNRTFTDLRPLIKANTPLGITGWYTLQISHYLGGDVFSNFTLRYGRYNSGNVNCSSATLPFSAEEAAADKDTVEDMSEGSVAPAEQ
jgi:hypothetical protein